MDIENIKIIKTLGAGIFGTTYKVNYENDIYALKIQKILKKDKVKNFNSSIWREIEMYNYINTLKPSEQQFFTKLHAYEFKDECEHKQKRRFKINPNDKIFKKLDESPYCVYLLLDYAGTTTLEKLFISESIDYDIAYSILTQLLYALLILKKGGYSHGDVYAGNIMIKKTDEKYFTFMNKKIPFYGYQLQIIDYGENLHKKYKDDFKNFYKPFLINFENYSFVEIHMALLQIITHYFKHIAMVEKLNKKNPWDIEPYNITIKKFILKEPEYYECAKNKYLKIYPESKNIIEKYEKNIETFKISNDDLNDIDRENFWAVMLRIIYEFEILHPKKHAEYFLWPTYHKALIPKEDALEFLALTNIKDIIKFLVSKTQT
jgi:serine/threonine protein kinase